MVTITRPSAIAIYLVGIALAFASPCSAQDDAINLVVEFLRDTDKDIQSLALEQVRSEVPGAEATKQFAALLPDLPAETQVGLLSALKDRGDSAAAPSVRTLVAESESEAVRVAAIKALGALGKAEDHAVLIDAFADTSAEVHAAAERALVLLPGDDSSTAIADRMRVSPAALKVTLIEILAIRRARGTIPAILEAAKTNDANVRRSAMTALGEIAEPSHVADMLQGVLYAEPGKERDAAERAVAQVCHRIEDPAQRADPVLKAIESMPPTIDRPALLNTLGRVGGPAAREEIEKVLSEKEHRDTALLALCNWPDGSVAFRLLQLARTDASETNRRRALMGLIRVAPLPDDRSDGLRLDLLKTAMAMCSGEQDKLRVLDRAKAVRTIDSLNFVKPFMKRKGFAEQACLTIVELAHHSGVREAHKQEFHAALDDVIATSDDPVVIDRAKRYKIGQTWVRPK